MLAWSRFFPTFFPGKIPLKIFSKKMLRKIALFRGKSVEKSFFQQIPRNFPRKITFRGKKMYEKSAPGANPTTYEFTATTPAL
jgi:hypothetical protein